MKRAARSSASLHTPSKASSDLAGEDDDNGSGCEGDLELGKVCLGCLRTSGVDSSLSTPGYPMAWLYAGSRGSLCRDCGNCFRIRHKPTKNVAMFDQWLDDPSHRREWLKDLISFLSLKRDGVSHVTAAMLTARCQMLDWLFSMLQIPWPFFEIHDATPEFLDQFASDSAGNSYLQRKADGTMMGLQAVAPMTEPPSSNMRFVTEAQASRAWPLQPHWSWPEGFMKAWQDHVAPHAHRGIGSTNASIRTSPAPKANASSSATAPPSASKQFLAQQSKLNGLTETTFVLFGSFVSGKTEMKEKDFGPLLQKVVKLRVALLDTPFADLVADLDQLASIIQVTKSMVKPYNEYQKSAKRSLLTDMYDHMPRLKGFLDKHNIRYGFEFGTTFAKAKFFSLCDAGGGLAAGLHFLQEYDYPWKAPEGDNFDEFTPHGIVTQCLMMRLLETLRQPLPQSTEGDGEEWSAKKASMLVDARACARLVGIMMQSHPLLKKSSDIFNAYITILAAASGCPTASPTDVGRAKTLINTEVAAVQVREGLSFGGIGLALVTDSDRTILAGELDNQCDADFRLLLDAIFSPGLPLAATESLEVVVDASLCKVDSVGTCRLLRMLQECLSQFAGVLKSWSAKRISDEVEVMSGLIQQAGLCIAAFDAARSHDCASAWATATLAWQTDLLLGDLDNWPPETQYKSKPDIAQPDEAIGDLDAVLDLLAKRLEQRAPFAPSLGEDMANLKGELAKCKANKATRHCIWAELLGIVGALSMPAEPAETMLSKAIGADDSPNLINQVLNIAELRQVGKGSFQIKLPSYDFVFKSSAEANPAENMQHSAFWKSIALGNLPDRLTEVLIIPLVDKASALFMRNCVAISNASVRMPAESWNSGSVVQVLASEPNITPHFASCPHLHVLSYSSDLSQLFTCNRIHVCVCVCLAMFALMCPRQVYQKFMAGATNADADNLQCVVA